jgi:hypothetical protein
VAVAAGVAVADAHTGRCLCGAVTCRAEGIRERGHILLAERGDYYTITDGLPQFDRFPEKGLSN